MTQSAREGKRKNGAEQLSIPGFELPDWVPLEAWQEWLAMRRRIRKPLVGPRAARRALTKLDQLRAEGQDLADVLDQSSQNCWTDVYPVHAPTRKAQINGGSSVEDRNRVVVARMTGRRP
ncbi:MAG: hypothetical protein KGL39_44290 [Patescibacteria group bacterium]|nr:hypothetical protein [Patescibacteria group bacterium]